MPSSTPAELFHALLFTFQKKQRRVHARGSHYHSMQQDRKIVRQEKVGTVTGRPTNSRGVSAVVGLSLEIAIY